MRMKAWIFALTAASATLLALPSLVSAQSAHLNATSTFTVEGGHWLFTRTDANTLTCTSVTGSGSFETTTTGKLKLTFHGCRNNLGFNCASTEEGHLASSQTITTTELPFHLIMYATNKPAVLITSNEETAVFSHFTCLGVKVTVTGNGLIGTITSPECGKSSTTTTMAFSQSMNGHQSHMLYTGTKYDLHSIIGASPSTTATSFGATATFPAARTLECTAVL